MQWQWARDVAANGLSNQTHDHQPNIHTTKQPKDQPSAGIAAGLNMQTG